jgi:replication factor C subunit 3/5
VNKVIPAIQSRCTKFRFGPLSDADIRVKLDEVVKKENVNIDEGGLKAIIKLAGGDMRKVLNVLQVRISQLGSVATIT